jgi:hypothetical protein
MTENTANSINCQGCGRLIGKYEQVGDQVHLKIGNVVLYKAHGTCVCGAEFHFLSSDLSFERLITKIKRKRINRLDPGPHGSRAGTADPAGERAAQPIDLVQKIIYNPNS